MLTLNFFTFTMIWFKQKASEIELRLEGKGHKIRDNVEDSIEEESLFEGVVRSKGQNLETWIRSKRVFKRRGTLSKVPTC